MGGFTGLANASSMLQLANSDYQQAMTIGTEMMADNQKQQMRRWQIMTDTQTKIFEIQQDVTVNKAKTQDRKSVV